MLESKDYIYHIVNGLGIITEVKDSKYYVRFKDTTGIYSPSSIMEMSKDMKEQILSQKCLEYFPRTTVYKGREYQEDGSVASYFLDGKNLSGVVSGNSNYMVNLSFTKDTIRARCSCPVGAFCKHSVALLFQLKEDMELLLHKEKPRAIAPISGDISEEELNIIQQLEDSDRRYYSFHLKPIDQMREILEKDKNYLPKLFSYLGNRYKHRRCSYTPIKRILASMPDIFEEALKQASLVHASFEEELRKTNSGVQNCYFRMQQDLYRGFDTELCLTILVAKKEYNQAVELLFASKNRSVMSSELPFLLERCTIHEEIIDDYRDYVLRYGEIRTITEAFLTYLPEHMKSYFFSRCDSIEVPISYVQKLPLKEQMEYLLRSSLKRNEMDYIVKNYYNFRESNRRLANQMMLMVGYTNGTYKKQALEYLNGSEEYYIYRYFLDPRKYKIDESDKYLLFQYLEPSYEIIEEEASFTIAYNLRLKDVTLLSAELDEYYHKIYSRDPLDVEEQWLVDYIEAIPTFQMEKEKVARRIEKKRFEQQRKLWVSKLNQFSLDLSSGSSIVLKEEYKMHVEVSISRAFYYANEGYSIEFRVGRDKLYVVKDVVEFLDAVNEGYTIKYGKGLEFNHQIKNFDAYSQKVLDYFLTLPYHTLSRESRKGYFLSENLFASFLKVMKGEELRWLEDTILVRLDPASILVTIDTNYRLNIDTKDKEIIDYGGLFLYDSRAHILDKIQSTHDEEQMIRFAYQNEGMDISVVKDEFIDIVYSRFSGSIQIADEIKPDFTLSDLQIDAYFDFDNHAIQWKTKLYKKEQEILASDLRQSIDRLRYKQYEDYVHALGFIEGELTEEASIYQFFTMDFTELRNLCNVYLSESIQNKTVSKMENQVVRITYENHMMEMFLEESVYNEEELYQILSALKKKKKYVLLKDDRIIDLDNEESQSFYATVTEMGMDEHHLYDRQATPIYTSLKAYAHKENVSLDTYVSTMIEEITHFKESPLEIPSVNATLRSYQREGVLWLRTLSKYNMGGILADDMGLGKTLEIITLLKSDDTRMPSLVVCPKSLLFNWVNEFERFDMDTPVCKIYGSQKERHERITSIARDEKIIYLTSYDSLRNDLEYYEGKVFNYMVLDEAQAIKNVHAVKSKSVKEITALHRFALTGTPIENNIIDLWSIFDYLMPGYFPELSEFKRRYESSSQYLEDVRVKTAPFILRRTKKEVLKDLPPKYERILSVDMTNEQRKVYDAYRLEAKQYMNAGGGVFDLLPYLMRLRQICIDPKLFAEEYYGKSGKMEEIYRILPEYIADGHRILLFSTFVKGLEVVEEFLKNSEIEYRMLTGSTKLEARQQYVNEFNQNPKIKVFLISLKAGGTGLNLVGADTVIHLDPWWNVSAENQATDRAYRIGQTKNVEVIKIVCEDSIEQRVIELQNIKKDIIEAVISDNDSSITNFSLDDLSFILR